MSFFDELKQLAKDAAPELRAVVSREVKSTAVRILNKDKNSPPVGVALPNAESAQVLPANAAPYVLPAALILGLIFLLRK